VACPWRTKKELQETLAHFVLLWQLLAFIFWGVLKVQNPLSGSPIGLISGGGDKWQHIMAEVLVGAW
jgi:hypothetical protein